MKTTLAILVVLLWSRAASARDFRSCDAKKIVDVHLDGKVATAEKMAPVEMWVSKKSLLMRQNLPGYGEPIELSILIETRTLLRAVDHGAHYSSVFTLNKKTGEAISVMSRDPQDSNSAFPQIGRVIVYNYRL